MSLFLFKIYCDNIHMCFSEIYWSSYLFFSGHLLCGVKLHYYGEGAACAGVGMWYILSGFTCVFVALRCMLTPDFKLSKVIN